MTSSYDVHMAVEFLTGEVTTLVYNMPFSFPHAVERKALGLNRSWGAGVFTITPPSLDFSATPHSTPE